MKRSATVAAVIVCAAVLAPISSITPAAAGDPVQSRIRVMSFSEVFRIVEA